GDPRRDRAEQLHAPVLEDRDRPPAVRVRSGGDLGRDAPRELAARAPERLLRLRELAPQLLEPRAHVPRPARELAPELAQELGLLPELAPRAFPRREVDARLALVALDPRDLHEPHLPRARAVRAAARREVEVADRDDPDVVRHLRRAAQRQLTELV